MTLTKKLHDKLSEMSEENKELSIRLYGKKIMCVISKNIPPRDEIFDDLMEGQAVLINDIMNGKKPYMVNRIIAFPEAYLSIQERIDFLNTLLTDNSLEELIVITSDGFIGSDFISQLTISMQMNEDRDILFAPIEQKLLAINIHRFYRKTIGADALCGVAGRNVLQYLIDICDAENKEIISEGKYKQIKSDISLVGEPVFEMKFNELIEEKYASQKKK